LFIISNLFSNISFGNLLIIFGQFFDYERWSEISGFFGWVKFFGDGWMAIFEK